MVILLKNILKIMFLSRLLKNVPLMGKYVPLMGKYVPLMGKYVPWQSLN